MKYVKNSSVNPYYNLAFEEYIFKNFVDDDFILFWQNDKTIVVGKHQNTIEEINEQAVIEYGVKVVRRITGGGAVYHDFGNLNFSFITNWGGAHSLDYGRFISPIIKGLAQFGVRAEQSGRNDIVVDGRKISGNAQAIIGNRVLHHGTILYNSDLDMIQEVLNVQTDKIQSKGVKSVRSRVANIKDYLQSDIKIADLIDACLLVFNEGDKMAEQQLTPQQLNDIALLAEEKYSTWQWNYGQSPPCNYKNAKRFPHGKVEINLHIKDGLIRECKIWGDFLALVSVADIENALKNSKYDRHEIKSVLEKFDLSFYFGNISLSELMECFE